jgi:hypothetical protein
MRETADMAVDVSCANREAAVGAFGLVMEKEEESVDCVSLLRGRVGVASPHTGTNLVGETWPL